MRWITNKKILIPVGLALAFGIGLGYCYYTSKLLEKSDSYTIGTINKITGAKGGLRVFIDFEFENKKYQVNFIDGSDNVSSSKNLGKRYFIKFIPEHPTMQININYSDTVPSNITTAPPKGWTNEWLRSRNYIK